MKRIGVILLCILYVLMLHPINLHATEQSILIWVDGKYIDCFDGIPYINQDGRTMVPIRFISEALGAKVTWDDITKTVMVKKYGGTINLVIGNNTISADSSGRNVKKNMDTAPVIENDRTFVPVRFISELLGSKVDWDENNRTVIIANFGEVVLGGNPALPDGMYMVASNEEISKPIYEGDITIKQEYIDKTIDLLNEINNVIYTNISQNIILFDSPRLSTGQWVINNSLPKWIQCIKDNKINKEIKFITDSSLVSTEGSSMGMDIRVMGKIQFIYHEPTDTKFLGTYGEGLEIEKWYTTDIEVVYSRYNSLAGAIGLRQIKLSDQWEVLK